MRRATPNRFRGYSKPQVTAMFTSAPKEIVQAAGGYHATTQAHWFLDRHDRDWTEKSEVSSTRRFLREVVDRYRRHFFAYGREFNS